MFMLANWNSIWKEETIKYEIVTDAPAERLSKVLGKIREQKNASIQPVLLYGSPVVIHSLFFHIN